MERLEEALRQALRRQDAPEDLTRRILAIPVARRASWRDWFRLPSLRWAVAAAAVLVLLLGVQHRAEEQRRERGEAAKRQMMMALQITAGKLEFAKQRIQKVTRSEAEAESPAKSI